MSNLEVEPEDITFTEDTIEVNLAGVTSVPPSALILDVDFAGDGGIVSIDGSNDFARTPEDFLDRLDGQFLN